MTTTLVAPPIYRTSIGKKVIMAASGLVLLLYVIANAYGMLHAFQGAKALDNYSDFLRRMGEPIFPRSGVLWIVRVAVGAAFLAHVDFAILVSLDSRHARQLRDAHPDHVQSNPAPFTMRWGGVAIGL